MKYSKRWISLLLSVVMLLSVGTALSGTAFGADSDTVTVNVVGKYDQTGARKMLDMINQFRAGNDAWYWNEDNKTKTNLKGKLQPYAYDYSLERIAMQRAAEIAVDYDHTRPDGTFCWTAYDEITAVGENIAVMYNSAASVFEGWQEINNPYEDQGHRRSMLSSSFTTVGIAHFVMNGVDYWVQEFRKGGVDATYQAPNNSETAVPVEVLKSSITGITLASEQHEVETAVGETAALPTIHACLFTKEHWPERIYIDARLDSPSWSIADRSIATVSGGKIKGVSAGDTTLTASYTVTASLKASVTVPIHVEGCRHEFNEVVLQEATCTEEGLLEKTCTKCGTVVQEAIPLKDHDFEEERIESTCLEQGSITRICKNCGTILVSHLPLGEHCYAESKTEPTCVNEGSITLTCTVCGDTQRTVLPMIAHQYVKASETPATCIAEGAVTEVCSLCGATRITPTAKIDHHYVPDSETPATCTAAGERIEKCTMCGRTVTTVLPKLAHQYQTPERVATCTQEGSIPKVCSSCGDTVVTVLPMLDHRYVKVSETAPTYTAAGSMVYECSECHDSYTVTVPKLVAKNGWQKENGKWYYYKNNVKQKGWQKLSGKWYYFNASGVMLTGWQKLSGKWYLFNSSGAMLTGWQKSGSKWYYFNASGAMLTGWQKLSGKWYYFNTGGDMVTGWKKIGSSWYYFESSGAMRTANLKQGSKTYRFNSSGVCLNP